MNLKEKIAKYGEFRTRSTGLRVHEVAVFIVCLGGSHRAWRRPRWHKAARLMGEEGDDISYHRYLSHLPPVSGRGIENNRGDVPSVWDIQPRNSCIQAELAVIPVCEHIEVTHSSFHCYAVHNVDTWRELEQFKPCNRYFAHINLHMRRLSYNLIIT